MKRFQNGLSPLAHCVFSWLLKASNNPGIHLGGKVFRRVLAGGLNSDLLVVGDVTTHPMRGEEVGGFISSHPCFFFGLPDTPCRQLVAAAVRWWVLSALYAILRNPMRYVRERRVFFTHSCASKEHCDPSIDCAASPAFSGSPKTTPENPASSFVQASSMNLRFIRARYECVSPNNLFPAGPERGASGQ